jgi:hypothetical protein
MLLGNGPPNFDVNAYETHTSQVFSFPAEGWEEGNQVQVMTEDSWH